MPDTITARDANHHFSRVLREVEGGKEFVVTRNGVAVAHIVPAIQPDGTRKLTARQEAALARSLERARTGWPLGVEKIDREELYATSRPWIEKALKE